MLYEKKPVVDLTIADEPFSIFSKDKLPKTSAGFPINYEEDSVGTYTLPEILYTDLKLKDHGQKQEDRSY